MILFRLLTSNTHHAAELSGMAQYLLAAIGPTLFGLASRRDRFIEQTTAKASL